MHISCCCITGAAAAPQNEALPDVPRIICCIELSRAVKTRSGVAAAALRGQLVGQYCPNSSNSRLCLMGRSDSNYAHAGPSNVSLHVKMVIYMLRILRRLLSAVAWQRLLRSTVSSGMQARRNVNNGR